MKTVNVAWSHIRCGKDSWGRTTVALRQGTSRESDYTSHWSGTGGGKGCILMLLTIVLHVPSVPLSIPQDESTNLLFTRYQSSVYFKF